MIVKTIAMQYASGCFRVLSPVISTVATRIKGRRHFASRPQIDGFTQSELRERLAANKGGAVELTRDDATGIATVTLNQSKRRNAFTGQMMVELADIIEELADWREGKAVLLRGAGGNFCSGVDLRFVRQITDPTGAAIMCQFMQATLGRLLALPLVSVALVEGYALGGGAELTTACDYRLVTPDTTIRFVQALRGVTPGWGGGCRLVDLVGRRTALHLLSSGRPLRGQQAVAVGLADDVVATDSALDEAVAWLTERTPASPALTQAVKRVVVNAAAAQSKPGALEREKEIFCLLWSGEEHEAVLSQDLKHK